MRAKQFFWVFALLVSAGIGPVLAADASVSISNFTFRPADLQIKAGSTVTFRNDDDIPHRVAAEDGSFSTKALELGRQGNHHICEAWRIPIFLHHPSAYAR